MGINALQHPIGLSIKTKSDQSCGSDVSRDFLGRLFSTGDLREKAHGSSKGYDRDYFLRIIFRFKDVWLSWIQVIYNGKF